MRKKMEQISPIGVIIGLLLTAFSIIGSVAYSYAKLTTKVDGINNRLDTMNGRLNRHSEDLKTQGQRVSKLEGKQEG